MKPLVLTPGEPAGIGPDITVMMAVRGALDRMVVVGDPDVLSARARQLRLKLNLSEYSGGRLKRHALNIIPVPVGAPVQPGRLDVRNARYVLKTLDLAAQGCLQGRFAGLVTGPVHKSIINQARIPFTGHTEYLARLCGSQKPVMLLTAQTLRVALATTHLPLKDVPAAITRETLVEVLTILHNDLEKRFRIDNPHILVCGLNPHAGEDGHLGTEEIETIIPTLEALRDKGLNLTGPLPADTVFTPRHMVDADAILAMYHDQGLPVLKHVGFGSAVNVTLGLKIIRTSVDHGTALTLAGTGKAETGSLKAAILLANQLAHGG
ncbi:MAG TPA: 4-hydroxythreonine-4-phosphate dehydrogenase PdxA [Gammaproteobacteria bacterium]|nr:4-hydroxythreonine-4-phosphate dehydrogenase PdxA [Gammaproteobacteria bacterium]